MTNLLPLYWNLIFGFLFLFWFTGTWLLVNDLSKLNDKVHNSVHQAELKSAFLKLRVRRILLLVGSIGLFILYFRGNSMNLLIAGLFGLFLLDTYSLTTRLRNFVVKMTNKAERTVDVA